MVLDLLGTIVRAQDIKAISEIQDRFNSFGEYVVWFEITLYGDKGFGNTIISKTIPGEIAKEEKTPEMVLAYDEIVQFKLGTINGMVRQEEIDIDILGGNDDDDEELEY